MCSTYVDDIPQFLCSTQPTTVIAITRNACRSAHSPSWRTDPKVTMNKQLEITPNLEALFGTRDENLHLLEGGLNVSIDLRSDHIFLEGAARDLARVEQVFADYEHLRKSGYTFYNGDLGSMLKIVISDPTATLRGLAEAGRQRSFGKRVVQPKSLNQRRYIEAIEKNDMVFCIGPAGTRQ